MIILREPARAHDFEFLAGDESNLNKTLGPLDALEALRKDGAKHVDIRWVQNHWALILWKLAAICRHVPGESQQRWRWGEVIRQLKYRYEREINRAHRSAIKRIQEHDSSAAQPMTLCVYQIDRSKDGEQIPPVVLTDGWYQIQTKIDETLFRAIVRGRLKVGQKLHISGARLECSGDGTDVLAAFKTSTLAIHANGCSLARWDARMGLCATPFISTMRSLCGSGGSIAAMRVEIVRVYPMAYIDMLPPEKLGNKSVMSTARNEAEELQAAAEWTRDRDEWRTKLEHVWNQQMRRSHLICELLQAAQRHAKGKTENVEEEFNADEILDNLEKSPDANMVLRKVPNLGRKINTLVDAAHQRKLQLQDEAHAELEAELDEKVGPRNVRSFRVIKAVDFFPRLSEDDAADGRKSCAREAQLTVWDAANLVEGELKVGNCFMITSLVPVSTTAWRGPDDDAEIFLATRKDTKWIRLS
ncbi:hypothetical protein K437DRAFT_225895 [Tilletiaria anomala UBC 951]|uniref:BRCA2 OB1 domain-containing protein n=1 Tax=Tilletiaria anomala (strain ATCC 24038 / CBS 436.72 / UBC 951) TaxID=1037660 RepID=A0A066VW16_TILAU|nr:uncharacterized protein K437DRAFT_225895 [Tilletiaria anomala UBC 951]KDN43004.1 hypothetical protein K437DRAFT_225895 [Tilletiaria anomala UBC 951]